MEADDDWWGRDERERARLEAKYAHRRRVTYGFYGVGAAAVVTGIVLRHTVYRDAPESAPRVTADVGAGGASVAVEWQR